MVCFDENKNWYKGNLHSHTVNSDGKLTPRQAARLFRKHGYNFLCLSEHDMYTDYSGELDSHDLIILPGVEASAVLFDGNTEERLKVHHIHGILGTKDMVRRAKDCLFTDRERLDVPVFRDSWNGAETAQKLTDSLMARGCFTVYDHPVWSRVEPMEVVDTAGLSAIEIFNYNTVNESSTGYDTLFWDMMLRRGMHINATASDDNHNEGLFPDACGGWIMVNAAVLDHDSIVTAIMSGNYYSSSGPEIYGWGVRNGSAFISCSMSRRISFIAGSHINDGRSEIRNRPGEYVRYAEYELKGNETYIRAECTDEYGNTAWTNPIYPDWQ